MSDLSHDARKSFSANESYHFFSYIKDFKASCSDLCFSVPNFVRLTSVFEELFIRETRRDKKVGTDDKTEKENLFHRFFIELLFEHVT